MHWAHMANHVGMSHLLVSVERIEPVVQLKVSFAEGHTATMWFILSEFNRLGALLNI